MKVEKKNKIKANIINLAAKKMKMVLIKVRVSCLVWENKY